MPNDRQVVLEDAHNEADNAAVHYAEMVRRLHRAWDDISVQALTGGYGVTGHYQGRLSGFGQEWLEKFDLFVADHERVVVFLERLRDATKGAQRIYQDDERDIAASFTDISSRLDTGGR